MDGWVFSGACFSLKASGIWLLWDLFLVSFLCVCVRVCVCVCAEIEQSRRPLNEVCNSLFYLVVFEGASGVVLHQ